MAGAGESGREDMGPVSSDSRVFRSHTRIGRRGLLLGLASLPLLPVAAAADMRMASVRADRVVVHKSERGMHLYANGRRLRSYRVALGRRWQGHKQERGDGRTPEGRYVLAGRLDVGDSAFHRSIRISYPNAEDVRSARERGVHPGSNIVIHGLPNGIGADLIDHPDYDWTNGCIAVTNEEMDEIWTLIADGTPIEIHP